MRTILLMTLGALALILLSSCSQGTLPVIPTGLPPSVETGAAQAPTILPEAANTAAAAVQAAATEAARAGGTVVPPFGTAAAEAVATAGPAVETAAAAAQTAIASPGISLPGQATPAPDRDVEVRLTEYAIEMPTALRAGTLTFRVTNAGTTDHNYVVEGQGIKEQFETNLRPGQTNTLQLTLAPGTYRVYCPVGGHQDRGMLVNLVVSP